MPGESAGPKYQWVQLTETKLCRDRKVRCGGDQPACEKCRRAGEECVYLAAQKPSKADLAQTVEALQKRLAEVTLHISYVPPGHQTNGQSINSSYLLTG